MKLENLMERCHSVKLHLEEGREKTPPTKASAMFSFFAIEEIEREMKEARKMNGTNNKVKSECKQSLTFTSLESPSSKDLVIQ
jgi:hypothetical protein